MQPNATPTPTPTTPEQEARDFSANLAEIRSGWAQVRDLPSTVKSLEAQLAEATDHLAQLRRQALYRSTLTHSPRLPGTVSDECAQHIAAHFILHCQKSDMLEALSSVSAQRDSMLAFARTSLNLTTRAALTTGDVPLPVQYGREIRELTSEFGVVRRRMSPYPIGLGVAKPARMGARPTFGSVAMSAALPEKSPTLTFASLESHKIGGIIRLPRELDEQSMVSMGQFLARYGAVEFARAEDTWGFLADGGVGYEGVKGIVTTAVETSHSTSLAAGKTKPSDATLDDFRAIRRQVNKAALSGRMSCYYIDTTWETRLPSFRTAQEPNVYQRLPDGSAILDGYPIVWTDILEPYGTLAAAGKPIAVFGALSFWWLGEHGTPRIDTSQHVWFSNDQLAVRFIEEIDFDYAAQDATSALLTAAV